MTCSWAVVRSVGRWWLSRAGSSGRPRPDEATSAMADEVVPARIARRSPSPRFPSWTTTKVRGPALSIQLTRPSLEDRNRPNRRPVPAEVPHAGRPRPHAVRPRIPPAGLPRAHSPAVLGGGGGARLGGGRLAGAAAVGGLRPDLDPRPRAGPRPRGAGH